MEDNNHAMDGNGELQPKVPATPEAGELDSVTPAGQENSMPEQETEAPTGDSVKDKWLRTVKRWLATVADAMARGVAFLAKHWRIVTLALVAVCAAIVALVVYSKVAEGKNRYESLGQTITEMKRISEFCTANYIGEVMIQDEEKKFLNRKVIVMIVRGKIRAGFDLTKMETEVVDDSTINVNLPKAQILDIITNPSDIRTFSEKGSWSHDRTTIAKNAARAKLLELVMEDNLLGTAEANGKMQLTSIFMAFGFKHVNIGFVADTTVCDTTAIVGDSVSGNATTLFSK